MSSPNVATWGEIIGGIIAKIIDDFPTIALTLILIGLCSMVWRKMGKELDALPVRERPGDGPS